MCWRSTAISRLLVGLQILMTCSSSRGLVGSLLEVMGNATCPGTIIVLDEHDGSAIDELISNYPYPIILFNSSTIAGRRDTNDARCIDFIVWNPARDQMISIHEQIRANYATRIGVIVMTDCASEQAARFAQQRGAEHTLLLTECDSQTEAVQLSFSGQTEQSNVNRGPLKDLKNLHLTVATLHIPPAVFIEGAAIRGTEPSLMDLLAQQLGFTYHYVQPPNGEMWGDIGEHTVTGHPVTNGLLGLLDRREADVAFGDMYMRASWMPHMTYSQPYKISYDGILVPMPPPYPKWKALIYPFPSSVWAVTLLSVVCTLATLRVLANRDNHFPGDLILCFLYAVGNLLWVQQPQRVASTPVRLFLIGWFLSATVLSTLYRSGLISFVTQPVTPSPIKTVAQLAESPLQKMMFGDEYKKTLINSSDPMRRKLGHQIKVMGDMSYMSNLNSSTSWAVDGPLEYLLHVASVQFPTIGADSGPRVNLLQEHLFSTRSAFAFQKGSPLKVHFDRKIQLMIEAGLVDHYQSKFAGKLGSNAKRRVSSNQLIILSLDNLQGAFYVFGIGITVSYFTFVVEITFNYLKER